MIHIPLELNEKKCTCIRTDGTHSAECPFWIEMLDQLDWVGKRPELVRKNNSWHRQALMKAFVNVVLLILIIVALLYIGSGS